MNMDRLRAATETRQTPTSVGINLRLSRQSTGSRIPGIGAILHTVLTIVILRTIIGQYIRTIFQQCQDNGVVFRGTGGQKP